MAITKNKKKFVDQKRNLGQSSRTTDVVYPLYKYIYMLGKIYMYVCMY